MSRNLILAVGVLLWTAVAVDAIVHAILGYWDVAAFMAIAPVAWVAVRRARWSPLRIR